MANDIVKRGPLPSLTLDKAFMNELWDNIAADGEFAWVAKVGTGGDMLGRQENRPEQEITDWNELLELLESLPRIDSINIMVEIAGKGVIGIVFRNFNPAGGILAVSTDDEAWGEAKYKSLRELFQAKKLPFSSKLYTRLGFGVVQTVIPLSVSFVTIMLIAGLLIPTYIRQSELIWWITALTLILTLRLAYSISDKLIIYVMKNYPYIRWLS
ncbi:MAG: hypothetical protein GX348_10740 [Veillonellaceae bacterium]|nr:hypothetical protein [Veillonellaceae bacterium]